LATDRIATTQPASTPREKFSSDSTGAQPRPGTDASTSEDETPVDARLASVRERIIATTIDGVLGHSPRRPLAIVAAGSLGREEDTILLRNGRAQVLGDAEFFLICFSAKDAQAIRKVLDSLVGNIQSQLARAGIDCPVTCGAVSSRILRKMSPHILGFELRSTGKVLWGDPEALELIPQFGPADIPKWDAWRSVSNRMIEQLACVDALWTGDRARVVELLYWTLKIQLELATLVLLFEGAYRPTYRERARELERLQKKLESLPWAAGLAERVKACTQFKLDPRAPSPYAAFFSGVQSEAQNLSFAREEFLAVLRLVRGVWLWGAERLLGRELDEAAEPLRVALDIARRQDWHWRARGWARFGLTDRGWKTVRGWQGFLRLASRGGPRFLLFAVSAALYFTAEEWLAGDSRSADAVAQCALRYFPFPSKGAATANWPEARNMVVTSWDHFLRPSWA
jgi:hypothetical protein